MEKGLYIATSVTEQTISAVKTAVPACSAVPEENHKGR